MHLVQHRTNDRGQQARPDDDMLWHTAQHGQGRAQMTAHCPTKTLPAPLVQRQTRVLKHIMRQNGALLAPTPWVQMVAMFSSQ
jgi:hypothetical protein